MPKEYLLPLFLVGIQSQAEYEKWLRNKAKSHFRRDSQRGNTTANCTEYRLAIHRAVLESHGVDAYTQERLDWSLLGKYNNADSERKGGAYKKKFALLPTVDHVGDARNAEFKICGWRTNDCKSDLSLADLIEFCKLIVKHH